MNDPSPPDWTEEPVLFECAEETLLGVLARPGRGSPSDLGVVVVVGGPQYRAGSHRQFTLLARALAGSGYVVLRFDCRGMGDSTGTARDFLSIGEDIGAAIAALQREVPTVKRIALWGLCDGASAALLYLHEKNDARVDRLILLNPWVRSEQGLARMHVKHYYRQRLMEPAFWGKLVRGKIASDAIIRLLNNLRIAASPVRPYPLLSETKATEQLFTLRMANAWNRFDGRILLLLSGNDYTAKEFVELAANDRAWGAALQHPALSRRDLQSADHTFSDATDARLMEQHIVEWLAMGGHACQSTLH